MGFAGYIGFLLLLSFGHNTPFFQFFFEHLPMFNKFRTPTMALVIPQLCFPLLAILALNEMLKGNIDTDSLKKKLLHHRWSYRWAYFNIWLVWYWCQL